MTPPRRRPERPLSLPSSHWRADGRPKVRFVSEREAMVVAAERAEQGGVLLAAYRCGFCQGWHLGRSGPKAED